MPEALPQTSAESQVNPTPDKKSRLLPIILIAIFCLLVGAGGAIAWQKYFPSQKQIPSPSSLSSTQLLPTPSLAPQIPTDWETYNNKDYYYSINYPSNAFQKEESNIQDMELRTTITLPIFGADIPISNISIAIIGRVPKSNIEDTALSFWNNEPQWGRSSDYSEIQDSTITNKPAKTFFTTFPCPEGDPDSVCSRQDVYIVSNSQYVFLILATYPLAGDRNSKNEKETINQILSTFKFLDQTFSPALSTGQTNGADLKDIKYVLSQGWDSELGEDRLDLRPISGGGYLSIKVYDYPGNVGRREYYCQINDFCIEGTSYFTKINIGNIPGYIANGLDNSGGGAEYFGEKGNKFYIISSYNPPSPNDFEDNYQNVLDSLVF